MSFDSSRFVFDPRKNYQGVLMQQGRVQLDSDWNEMISESSRAFQTASLDTLGPAVVPMQTPNAFNIAQDLSIGPGRIYVDGLLVENHGLPTNAGGTQVWDPLLAEISSNRTVYTPFTEQPYLPNAALPAPAVSPIPVTYLAYVDAWQRELTYLQKPDLVDKAIGLDTTGRYQTIWQVKMLEVQPEFLDVYGSSASLSNYTYYDQNWTSTTAAAESYSVVSSELRQTNSGSFALGSYLIVNSPLFNPSQTSYTLEADFKVDAAAGLFGLVCRATASNDAAYIFQWNGLNNRWEIEKQKSPAGNYDYVATSTTSPYSVGTWVHFRFVVGPGNLFNAYITPASMPEQQIFTNVSDTFSTPAPYVSGGIGLRSYDILPGNTLHVQNFQAQVTVGINNGYPAWTQLTLPSSGQLTTGQISSNPTPMENQLYRAEVHQGGSPMTGLLLPTTATFKWSRDNGSMAARVVNVDSADNETIVLTMDNVTRGDIQLFSEGDWVELTNDELELNGLPGEMHRVATGGVDRDEMTVTLVTGLFGTAFTPGPGMGSNARLRRWDQQGKVYLNDGKTVWYDLDSPSSGGVIPVPPAGVTLILENGITAAFGLNTTGNGVFNNFDYWCFASRAADNSVEVLTSAPPRGIYHHYVVLAQVTYTSGTAVITDQRNLWSPSNPGMVTVTAEQHNSGEFTIQEAVNQVQNAGGGTVCLGPGTFNILTGPLTLNLTYPLVLEGNGDATILAAPQQVILVNGAPEGLVLKNFQLLSSTSSTPSLIYFSLSLAAGNNVLVSGITINTGSSAIGVNSFNTTIENIEIPQLGSFNPAIGCSGGANVELNNIHIVSAPSIAVEIYVESNIRVKNLRVDNFTLNTVPAIYCLDSSVIEIDGCVMAAGIYCDSTSDIRLTNLTITGPGGFFVTKSVNVFISGISVLATTPGVIAGTVELSSQIVCENLHFSSFVSSPSPYCSNALQLAVCTDVVVNNLRGETASHSVIVSNVKNGRLAGLDLDTQAQAVQITNSAGITVENSTFRSSTGNTAFSTVGCTGITFRSSDIQANGQAAVITTSADVDLNHLEIVCVGVATNTYGTAGQDQAVIVLGPQCVNTRITDSSIVLRGTYSGSVPPPFLDTTAIFLFGWLAGIEIRGNRIQSDVAAISAGSFDPYYLSTFGLIIENNHFMCNAQAISLTDNCFHAGVTRIANNTVSGCLYGGITVTGCSYMGSMVEILSNQMNMGGYGATVNAPALTVGLDARIDGNQITGSDPAAGNFSSTGILLGGGLNPVIANCTITENRLTNLNGVGIQVEANLSSAVISRNFLSHTQGGILFRNEGQAQSVLVEGNELLDIDCPTNSQPPSGIAVFNTTTARMIDNQLNTITCQGGVSVPSHNWGTGLLTVATHEQHFSGNEVVNVNGGAGVDFMSSLAAFEPFDRVDIESNEVRYSNDPINDTKTGLPAPYFGALSVLSYQPSNLTGFNLDGGTWTSNAAVMHYFWLAIDSTNGILYATCEEGVQKFDLSTGNYIGPFVPFTLSGSVVTPVNLAAATTIFLDGSGNIYIGDNGAGTGRQAIYKTDPTGLVLAKISGAIPDGIYVDSSANIYSSEDGTSIIYFYAFSGGSYAAGVPISLSGYALGQPAGLYISGTTLYVADALTANVVSYQMTSPTTFISGMVVNSASANPQQVTVDASGTLYVASAGDASLVVVPTSGPSSKLFFTSVIKDYGVAVDSTGDVYLSGWNGHVTKLDKIPPYPIDAPWTANATVSGISDYNWLWVDNGLGVVYATAGTSIQCFNLSTGVPLSPFVPYTIVGGVHTPVTFYGVNTIFKDSLGNFYLGDNGVSTGHQAIYVTDSTGFVLNTISGFVADGLFVDSSRNIYATQDTTGDLYYFAYSGGSYSAGTIVTLSGDPITTHTQPAGVFIVGSTLYLADSFNGRVATYTGSGTSFAYSATLLSSIPNPLQLYVDGSGTLYVTLAGISQIVIRTSAGYAQTLSYPTIGTAPGIFPDSSGNVYLSGSNGHVTKLDNVSGYSIDATWTANAEVGNYHALAINSPDGITGIIYAASGQGIQMFDLQTGNYLGALLTFQFSGPTVVPVVLYNVFSLFMGPDGNLYAGEQGFGSQQPVIYKIDPSTGQILYQIGGGLFVPNQIYVDPNNNVYVTNNSTPGSVYLCQPSGGTYTISTITLPALSPTPLGVVTGIYLIGTTICLADSTNNRIVTFNPDSSGSYLTGQSFVWYSTNLTNPQQLTADGFGNIYVANTTRNNFVVLNFGRATITSPSITVGSLSANVYGLAVDGLGNVYAGAVNSLNLIKLDPVLTQPSVLYLSTDTWVFNINGTQVLTANGDGLSLTVYPTGRVETVRVVGNQLEGNTTTPIQVLTTGECQLTNNYCAVPVTFAIETGGPVVFLESEQTIVTDNRTRGGNGFSIALSNPGSPSIVSGNITTRGVFVNNAYTSAVWSPLNITG